MKKIINVILVFTVAFFISCDVEPIGSDTPIAIIDPSLPTNPGDVNTEDGDYWPTTIGNYWDLDDLDISNNSITYEVIGEVEINGLDYSEISQYSVQNQSGIETTANSYLRKVNGDYFFRSEEIELDAGGVTGTITSFEYILLKDYLEVDDTWTGTFSYDTTFTGSPTITANVNYVGTILDKGATETINGEMFEDIIKVNIQQTVTIFGTEQVAETESWYAKNIGLIKSISYNAGIVEADYTIGDYNVQ